MSFDFSTLITDRNKDDVTSFYALLSKPMSTWTPEELSAFNDGLLKGGYWWTDLNRVTACMEYLDKELRKLGYSSGYDPVVVHKGQSRLPDGYTELQYIQSSGAQYIDTGFIPNQDTRIVYDMERISAASAEHFFGVRTGSSTVKAFNFYIYNGGWRSGYNRTTNNGDDPSTGRYLIDKNKNVTTISHNSVQELELTATYGNFTCDGAAYLFAMQNAPNSASTGSHRLFSCQIYDDGTIARNFVPCTAPDNEIGLYDLIGKTFYGNSGTGEFVAGPEIPRDPEVEKDPYTWYKDDSPTISQIDAYLANVQAIKASLHEIPGTPNAPKTMTELFNYAEANNIEKILVMINDMLENIKHTINLGWALGIADIGLYGGV